MKRRDRKRLELAPASFLPQLGHRSRRTCRSRTSAPERRGTPSPVAGRPSRTCRGERMRTRSRASGRDPSRGSDPGKSRRGHRGSRRAALETEPATARPPTASSKLEARRGAEMTPRRGRVQRALEAAATRRDDGAADAKGGFEIKAEELANQPVPYTLLPTTASSERSAGRSSSSGRPVDHLRAGRRGDADRAQLSGVSVRL